MGLSDIAKGAALVLGVGILAERFGAGTGLGGLGAGVASIVSAPGIGIGAGLSGTASGIRDIGSAIGSVAEGFKGLFNVAQQATAYTPNGGVILPSISSGPYIGLDYLRNLINQGGGDNSTLLAGGGGNVPLGGDNTVGGNGGARNGGQGSNNVSGGNTSISPAGGTNGTASRGGGSGAARR